LHWRRLLGVKTILPEAMLCRLSQAVYNAICSVGDTMSQMPAKRMLASHFSPAERRGLDTLCFGLALGLVKFYRLINKLKHDNFLVVHDDAVLAIVLDRSDAV
jgi:hypothetical protein